MTVLTGTYAHHELRLIYSAKGDVCEQLAALAEPGVLSDRIPNWLRANAASWYALAAKEAEKENAA